MYVVFVKFLSSAEYIDYIKLLTKGKVFFLKNNIKKYSI